MRFSAMQSMAKNESDIIKKATEYKEVALIIRDILLTVDPQIKICRDNYEKAMYATVIFCKILQNNNFISIRRNDLYYFFKERGSEDTINKLGLDREKITSLL